MYFVPDLKCLWYFVRVRRSANVRLRIRCTNDD